MVDVISPGSSRKPVTKELIERNIVINNRGCWLWQGATTPKGYGYIGQWTRYAHREAYKLWIGEIPKGTVLDHRCSQKGCCNPSHMVPVTPSMNTQLAFIEKYKQMPWKSLRVARHLHNLVGESPSIGASRAPE